MKKGVSALVIVLALVAIGGFKAVDGVNSDAKKAQTLASKACGDDSNDSFDYQERAKLAAQAFHLDSKWERLADSTNVLAGVEDLNESKNSWINAPGNDGVAISLKNGEMYAQFIAECSILP